MEKSNSKSLTEEIRNKGREAGFDLVSFSPARQFPEHLKLSEWISKGNHGTMEWMVKTQEKRINPLNVMPEAKTVIVCALNYNTDHPYSMERGTHPLPTLSHQGRGKNLKFPSPCGRGEGGGERGWIARYAWGEDYHEVMEKKLGEFAAAILSLSPSFVRQRRISLWPIRRGLGEVDRKSTPPKPSPYQPKADPPLADKGEGMPRVKYYVDTGPVMDRVFAANSGIGWVGKNTCIIHPNLGSWLFLGVILTSLELKPDLPVADHCGKCTACIDACPTDALVAPRQLDARRCISYLTIEHRGEIKEELSEKMGNHIFGCDICQDVCPWNQKAPVSAESAFQPRESFFYPNLSDFLVKVEKDYPAGFKNSPLKRAKKEGLLRNLRIAQKNARKNESG